VAWAIALAIWCWVDYRHLDLRSGYPLHSLLVLTPYATAAAIAGFVVVALLRRRVAAVTALLGTAVLAAGIAPRVVGGEGAPSARTLPSSRSTRTAAAPPRGRSSRSRTARAPTSSASSSSIRTESRPTTRRACAAAIHAASSPPSQA